MAHFILDLLNPAPTTQPTSHPGKPRAPMSEETKRKISEAKTGIPRSEETKRKISEARKGKPRPPEVRAKIAETKKRQHRGQRVWWTETKQREHGAKSKAGALAGKGYRKPPGFRATMRKVALARGAANRAARDAAQHAHGLGKLRPPAQGRTRGEWGSITFPVKDGKILVTAAQLGYLLHLNSLAGEREHLVSSPYRDGGTVTHVTLHGWRSIRQKRDPDNGRTNVFGKLQPCRLTSIRFLAEGADRYVPFMTMELVMG